MQREILDANPEADIRVYAVWFNMLVADDRSSWDLDVLPDARVTHWWDEGRRVGCWYAVHDRPAGSVGPVVWDAYYLYGPEAVWEAAPEPLLGKGVTILGRRGSLSSEIMALLGQAPRTDHQPVRFVGTPIRDPECRT